MNKEPENTNKELLKLKQELNELNCRISTQQKHIQKLCSEVEEREKELRFYHKAEKILNNTSLSPEKNFQKVVDLLPAAFQFPERTAISLKINEWIFNSKEFIDSNIFIEANIQIENSLIGFIKACYNYDGQKKISNKFLKEEKNLLKILSKRLSEYYVKYLNDLELKKNEDTYQNLVDNINDIIYEITADGTLTYINNAAFLISGYHPNELIGKSFFEKIYPNDLPIVYKALSELGNEKHINIEFRYLGKDGNIKWVRSSTKPILENGIAIGGRGVLIDIHETKTAQILLAQNEKKLQFKTRLQKLLVDISNKYINLPLDQIDFKINKSLGDLGKFIGADRFYIFDYDFDQQTCSNTYEWCAEGIEAQIDELQNVPFEYFPEWLNAHCKGETLYVEDVLALDPEDNLRIILEPQGIKSLVAVPIMDADKCIGFTGFDAVIDYHTYSSEEVELLKVFAQMLVNIKNRLKNQHELEKSNQKINVLLNNLSGVIYHSDFDGRNWNLSFMNDAVFELTGYKAADFINNTKIEFNDLIDKEDLPRVLEEVQKATKNKLPYNIEYRIYTAEGQQKWVWEKGHGVFEGKKLIGLEGFISDITEKKQIEEELLKSEEELNQAQEIAKMGSWFMNLLTGEITLSHNYYKLVERAEKDTKSKEDLLLPLIHKDDIHLIENKLVEIAAAKSQGTQELRLIMPDGRIKWVQSTILPVYHNDVLVAYKGVKIDITEKKLQESEIHKLINVVEQSPISIIVTNIDGSIEYANPKACEISGYTKEELETKNPRIFKSGETQQQEYYKLWKTISSGKEWKGIFHNKKKDGSLYWESANIAPIFDSYGNITQYLALKEDITRKKELNEELALKEFRYRELAEHSQTVIWEVDANGLYTYVSPMAEYVYGFSADELIHKKHFYDIAPEEAREDVKTFGFETLRQGVLMVNFENQVERKDGKIIWVNTNARPFFDEENNIIGYRGSDNDITEKKLQEEEISLKNAKLNAILDAMPDMIFTSDSDGNYLEFFKLFKNKKINDYSYLIGKNIEDEFPADVAALHIEKIKACLQTKKLISYEYPKVEDGKTRYFDGRIVFMDQDKVLCFVRDITNRKEQENEIKKLTIAIEQSPIAIVITNLDSTIQYVSPAFQKITGYSKEEVIGKKPSILKSGQTSDTVYKNLWTTISAGNIWNGEFLNKNKNGDLYWESISITPIQDENKLTTGYLALKEDITEQKNAAKEIIELNANLEVKIDERTAELQQTNNILQQEIEQRKQIEEALSKSEYNYRSVIENVNEVIFKTDENGLWLFLNKSWEEITGFTVEESLGQLFVNYVHPEDRQRNMELFMPLINREKDYCRHQVRYLTKAGGFRWIEVFARLAVNEFDEITGTYGTLNDITERKKAEDELKIEKQRLASIIEGTNVGTWEWNIKTGEIIFNERWANILGYSLEEISPISIETWIKFTHPEDLDKSNELLQMHFQGKLAYYTLESRMKHRNGSWIWVLANGKVNAWDTDGKPLVMSGTHLDITERKKAEEELKIEKQRLASFIEGTNVGTWEWNIKTGETKFNERWANILGYSLEEISPISIETWIKFTHPEDLDKSNELLQMHFQGKLAYYTLESRMKHRNGSWIWVLANGKVNAWDTDGKPLVMSGTHLDITERKKAEEELKIEKQRLASFIEGTNVGTWEWNIKTGETKFNERWANILGYSLEEISPISIETWIKFTHPEDLDKSNELLQMHFQGKLAYYTLESRMKHRNGSWIWVLANGKVNAWDTDGKPLVMSGTHLDITERKKAEEELNWNKTLLELMSNSSPFGFLVVDNRTDDILYFNKRFCQIWEIEHLQEQIERGELKNNDIIPFCIPVLADVSAFAESCKPLQSEENRMVLDDEISFTNNRTIRRFTTQIRGNNDEYFGRFYIFEDITEDKRKSEELIKARNEAIIANKAKSTFLANMSHEIRTPMNAILGYSDILNTVITEKTHKEFINSIQTSGKSLLSIINDVLDLAKIEADKIELEFDYIKTASFFSEFKDIFGPKLKKNRVDFVVEIAEDIPDGLYVDEARLRQVLINLIGNSVKFTPKGFIKVSVTFENPQTVAYSKDKSEAFIDLIIKVEDTGIGISEELHDKIFEEFVQAEGKNIQGTGLGLTISKRLVNLMNGTLSVTSKINKGSVFKITIPEVAYLNSFNKKLPDNFINPENILFEKATILVVDDIEINRRYIKDVFKNSKIKIIEASSGKIGLKKAEEIIPDLIISDIRMPEMDGFEFLDLMKQNINLRQIPVIAYSASVMKEQKKRIYESGFASLLTKPVLLDELINEICKYLPYQLKQPELHDYIESKENITDLEGLIQTFENQFTSNWTALKKRQPIGEIKEFSKNIIAAGKLHHANFIISYGEEMLNAAENFNIDKVLTLLKEYPKLIKNLNNLWKP